MFVDVGISGDRNVIKKEDEKFLKFRDRRIEISARVECESKSDTGNNRGNWYHFQIIQTIPEQHTGKARNYGATKKTAILSTANVLRVVMV